MSSVKSFPLGLLQKDRPHGDEINAHHDALVQYLRENEIVRDVRDYELQQKWGKKYPEDSKSGKCDRFHSGKMPDFSAVVALSEREVSVPAEAHSSPDRAAEGLRHPSVEPEATDQQQEDA